MYGFIADPHKTTLHNTCEEFSHMTTWLYFSRSSNMALHDLTTKQKSPSNLKMLLGLNLKFIPRRRFTTTDLTETVKRFKQQVYKQDYYLNNPLDSNNENTHIFNPKLHVQTHWLPSPWKISSSVITHTENFLNEVGTLFHRKQCTPNLSFSQLHLLKFLRKKQDFIIVKADKNLGPCILETERYIQYALQDHLNCRQTYKKLSFDAASKHMDIVEKNNYDLSSTNTGKLSPQRTKIHLSQNKRM